MIKILQKEFSTPEKETPRISLLFSNATEQDILLKGVLDSYATKFSNRFQVFYTLTRSQV